VPEHPLVDAPNMAAVQVPREYEQLAVLPQLPQRFNGVGCDAVRPIGTPAFSVFRNANEPAAMQVNMLPVEPENRGDSFPGVPQNQVQCIPPIPGRDASDVP